MSDWAALGITCGVLLVLGMFDKTRGLAIIIAVVLALLLALKTVSKKGLG